MEDVNSVSIVVASKYPDIFAQCRGAIDARFPAYPKYVVADDDWKVPGWTVLQAPLPFRGMASLLNIGIQASAPDDVMWVQDDVTVLSADLITSLQSAAYNDPLAAAVSPVMEGGVGNLLQQIGDGCTDEVLVSPTGLGFMCIYFRRDLLQEIGLMDERFTGYGPDDADWCKRAQIAGYRLLIARSVCVRHGFGADTWACTFRRREPVDPFATLPEMTRIYAEKWGGL